MRVPDHITDQIVSKLAARDGKCWSCLYYANGNIFRPCPECLGKIQDIYTRWLDKGNEHIETTAQIVRFYS